jgi:hypothetical protein
MAAAADIQRLYELSVQDVSAEVDFVDRIFRQARRRAARTLREDFCGTGALACEWGRRRPKNEAWGMDIDRSVLEWGQRHNCDALPRAVGRRVHLLERDVLRPGEDLPPLDLVLAMNMSYWLFRERRTLRSYFAGVHSSLGRKGLFFLDHFGGHEAYTVCRTPREVLVPRNSPGGGRRWGFDYVCTYVWDQAEYDPISGELGCAMHWEFPDGSTLHKAFDYRLRMWTLPEVREILSDVGFRRSTVYWWREDASGAQFLPTESGEAGPFFVAWIVAEP